MSEHTPTPWHDDDIGIFAGGGVIARIPNHPENGKNWKNDAAFIVKAVNNHDRLVQTLRAILALCDHAESYTLTHFADKIETIAYHAVAENQS